MPLSIGQSSLTFEELSPSEPGPICLATPGPYGNSRTSEAVLEQVISHRPCRPPSEIRLSKVRSTLLEEISRGAERNEAVLVTGRDQGMAEDLSVLLRLRAMRYLPFSLLTASSDPDSTQAAAAFAARRVHRRDHLAAVDAAARRELVLSSTQPRRLWPAAPSRSTPGQDHTLSRCMRHGCYRCGCSDGIIR